jgi:hypothetical protein
LSAKKLAIVSGMPIAQNAFVGRVQARLVEALPNKAASVIERTFATPDAHTPRRVFLFRLINLKTAKTPGLKVPTSLLVRARGDRVTISRGASVTPSMLCCMCHNETGGSLR